MSDAPVLWPARSPRGPGALGGAQVADETAMQRIATATGPSNWADAVLDLVSGPTMAGAAVAIAAVTVAAGRRRAPAVLGIAAAMSVLLAGTASSVRRLRATTARPTSSGASAGGHVLEQPVQAVVGR